jgi:hypothetical protein
LENEDFIVDDFNIATHVEEAAKLDDEEQG